MSICRNLMVQLGLSTESKHKVLQWDCSTVPIKEAIGLLGQIYLTSCKMRKVVI